MAKITGEVKIDAAENENRFTIVFEGVTYRVTDVGRDGILEEGTDGIEIGLSGQTETNQTGFESVTSFTPFKHAFEEAIRDYTTNRLPALLRSVRWSMDNGFMKFAYVVQGPFKTTPLTTGIDHFCFGDPIVGSFISYDGLDLTRWGPTGMKILLSDRDDDGRVDGLFIYGRFPDLTSPTGFAETHVEINHKWAAVPDSDGSGERCNEWRGEDRGLNRLFADLFNTFTGRIVTVE